MGYMFSDIKRILQSPRFYIAIIGVCGSLLFSLEQGGISQSVCKSYISALNHAGFLMTFLFCAFAYGNVFCEEMEYHYAYYEMIRGNRKSYLWAKVAAVYFSSIAVMVLGTLLFLLFCKIWVPWGTEMDSCYEVLRAGNYSFFIEKEQYLIYCLLFSLQMGMIAGVLSLVVAFCSLFVRNQMLVMILPILIYQCLYLMPDGIISVYTFWPIYHYVTHDGLYFCVVTGISMLAAVMISCGIYVKIKNE